MNDRCQIELSCLDAYRAGEDRFSCRILFVPDRPSDLPTVMARSNFRDEVRACAGNSRTLLVTTANPSLRA